MDIRMTGSHSTRPNMESTDALMPRQHSSASSRDSTLPRVHQPRSGNVAMNHIASRDLSCDRPDRSPNAITRHIPAPPPPVSASAAAAASSLYANTKRGDYSEQPSGLQPLCPAPRYDPRWTNPAMEDTNPHRTSNGGVVTRKNDPDEMDKATNWASYDIDTTSESNLSEQKKYSDWRRSAVLTIFLFPPTGLVAMIAAWISYSYGEKGQLRTAEQYARCSCWMVFVSLILSVVLILSIILLRMYGYISQPF